MPGYSGTPLVKKLGLRDGQRIALRGAPAGFRELLEPLPRGVRWMERLAPPLDCIILFASDSAALNRELRRAADALAPAGMLWIAWPKQAAKVPTDLTSAAVREAGLATGLVDVKVCAVTDIWSGLKFVRRLKDR
jgi:hypothetical protein